VIGHKESPALAGLSVRRNVEPENRTCGYMIDREHAASCDAGNTIMETGERDDTMTTRIESDILR
jgi:hypothetical protein